MQVLDRIDQLSASPRGEVVKELGEDRLSRASASLGGAASHALGDRDDRPATIGVVDGGHDAPSVTERGDSGRDAAVDEAGPGGELADRGRAMGEKIAQHDDFGWRDADVPFAHRALRHFLKASAQLVQLIESHPRRFYVSQDASGKIRLSRRNLPSDPR
jgi:hypothetical protein